MNYKSLYNVIKIVAVIIGIIAALAIWAPIGIVAIIISIWYVRKKAKEEP